MTTSTLWTTVKDELRERRYRREALNKLRSDLEHYRRPAEIDDLLAAVDSKYTLVILAAKRAREINSYYSQLGEGRAEFIPPLIESGGLTNKPLSIALEEIAEGKIDYERPEEPADE